jgi:aryl-alcohol dehydrogenase-like predicted oxidoreductase
MSQQTYVADLLVAPPATDMEYTRLGTSGLKISKVVLGAMTFGSKGWVKWVLDEEEALPLLEHAYRVGINTWDTVSISMS